MSPWGSPVDMIGRCFGHMTEYSSLQYRFVSIQSAEWGLLIFFHLIIFGWMTKTPNVQCALILSRCEKKKNYTGCPKKHTERLIFSTLRAKSVIFFTLLNKASSAEENDTKIIEFDWVIFKFRSIFATDERRIVSGKAFHMVICGSPLIRVNKRYSVSGNGHLKGHSRRHTLIGRKNEAKFENDCFKKLA